MSNNVINPSGAMIIWNYSERFDASTPNKNPHKLDNVIINTASIVHIETQKTKSIPAGTFRCRLAPTKNWVAEITPGSWCAILMSRSKLPTLSTSGNMQADEASFKMLGRVESCRLVSTVDNISGARSTYYLVTGKDWGSVFDTHLYIDPIYSNNALDKLGPMGHSARLLCDKILMEWNSKTLPTSSDVIKALLKLWGSAFSVLNGSGSNSIFKLNNVMFASDRQFLLPREVAKFMHHTIPFPAADFSSLIKVYDGILKSYDKYSGDTKEAYGFPSPSSLIGVHKVWQILSDNMNSVLNELLTDIRWEDGSPKFALYKRVRPFVNRDLRRLPELLTKPDVLSNVSMFKNVRRIKIPLNDIISVDAGTNWNNRINFIEVRIQSNLLNGIPIEGAVKADSQLIDPESYARDGFKPMVVVANYIKYKSAFKDVDLTATLNWKYLLREWYFNTHILLNGSISIVTQDKYIQVGDNIMIPTKALSQAPFNKNQRDTTQETYLLAHVESINHTFAVNSTTGARSIQTTINFVRGIITNEEGEPIQPLITSPTTTPQGAIDKKSDELSNRDIKLPNVIGRSTENDPDPDKLKGN